MARDAKKCAYCGGDRPSDKEHVFPASLYPRSRATSRVQRLTVPSCRRCNAGWADDEAHFRNVLVLAGDGDAPTSELWTTTVASSFAKCDGHRRVRELYDLMRPVTIEGEPRYMVYPGQDPRVIRIVKKIIRGLNHHHQVSTALDERRVWAGVPRLQWTLRLDLR